MRELLADLDDTVRRAAAIVLVIASVASETREWRDLAQHPSPDVRGVALRSLAMFQADPSRSPEIRAALVDKDPSVRIAAARASGKARLRDAVPRLVAMLERGGEETSVAAVALGALGAVEAVEPLLAALSKPDADARALRTALWRIAAAGAG